MKIAEIKRTMSFGQYENITMTAQVGEGEDPKNAVLELEDFMRRHISGREKAERLWHEIDNLIYRKDYLTEEVNRLEDAKKIYEDEWQQEIPF